MSEKPPRKRGGFFSPSHLLPASALRSMAPAIQEFGDSIQCPVFSAGGDEGNSSRSGRARRVGLFAQPDPVRLPWRSPVHDSQRLVVLKQVEAGSPVPELCRQRGISSATRCRWRSKFAGMIPSPIARMQQLGRRHRKRSGRSGLNTSRHPGRSRTPMSAMQSDGASWRVEPGRVRDDRTGSNGDAVAPEISPRSPGYRARRPRVDAGIGACRLAPLLVTAGERKVQKR